MFSLSHTQSTHIRVYFLVELAGPVQKGDGGGRNFIYTSSHSAAWRQQKQAASGGGIVPFLNHMGQDHSWSSFWRPVVLLGTCSHTQNHIHSTTHNRKSDWPTLKKGEQRDLERCGSAAAQRGPVPPGQGQRKAGEGIVASTACPPLLSAPDPQMLSTSANKQKKNFVSIKNDGPKPISNGGPHLWRHSGLLDADA